MTGRRRRLDTIWGWWILREGEKGWEREGGGKGEGGEGGEGEGEGGRGEREIIGGGELQFFKNRMLVVLIDENIFTHDIVNLGEEGPSHLRRKKRQRQASSVSQPFCSTNTQQ